MDPEIAPVNGECAIADHYRNKEHVIDCDNAIVLDREKNLYKRKILENLHIMATKNTCNYRNDTNGISRVYASIIETIKK
jgi:hypothetical protein